MKQLTCPSPWIQLTCPSPWIQTWTGLPPNGVLDDNTWFTWMEPGSASQLTLEAASNLTDGLL
ncbi:MAG: hypothetical protein WBZ19_16585 [Chthoniobacterales bacterium]